MKQEETIAAVEVPNHKLTKPQLIAQIDTLNEYIVVLEREKAKMAEDYNRLEMDMNNLGKRAENIMLTKDAYYEKQISTIIGMMESIKVLLTPIDFSQGKESK